MRAAPTRSAMSMICAIRSRWCVPIFGARASAMRKPRSGCASKPPSSSSRTDAASSPYTRGGLHHETQLRLLVFGGKRIAAHGARETTLRRDTQIFERREARCLIDTRSPRALVFEYRSLAAYKAEPDELVFRHEAQRREIASAWRVVLEKEPIDTSGVEQAIGDRLVTARRHPSPAQIAAA